MKIITIEDEQSEQPANFNVTLYPYQLSTIKYMEKLESSKCIKSHELYYEIPVDIDIQTNVGVLSNKVGSGKSLIILGLCKRNINKFKEVYTQTVYNKYTESVVMIEKLNFPIDNTYKDCSIIIIPSNLLKQWTNDLNKTDIRYITINSKKSLDMFNEDEIDNYDIILCTSFNYNNFFYKFKNITWKRVIIDEADSIKRINTTDILYDFIWFVTATTSPTHTTNMLYKPYIGINDFNIKCSDDYIDSYTNIKNIINYNYIECYTPIFSHVLHGYISSSTQEFINAGDINNAILSMGGKVNTDQDLIALFTTNTTKKIEDLENKIKYITTLNISENLKKKSIGRVQNEIKSLETSLNSISEKINNIGTDKCAICLDNFINPVMTNCCKNITCFECLINAYKVKKACIFCRETVDINKITHIDKNIKVTSNEKKLLKKEDNCIEIIKSNPGGKYLIFSNHYESFNIISKKLNNENINYNEVKGGYENVNRIIKKYNNGLTNVLLLNSKNSGAGLNLNTTTDIIIYHEMSRELEVQIIGRALRIGRDPDLKLNIWYLHHDNEYIEHQKK